LFIGDDIFLGLLAAKMGLKVVKHEARSFYREIQAKQIETNKLQNEFTISSTQAGLASGGPYNLILSDVYYFDLQRVVEWSSVLRFWSEKSEIGETPGVFSEDVICIPSTATLRGKAVEFTNFHKQFAEVSVPHIDLTTFNSAMSSVSPLTVHPLWMYPFTPLSETVDILQFDFSKSSATDEYVRKDIECTKEGTLHAVALWVDYALGPNHHISTAPEPDDSPSWKRQAVWMLPYPYSTISLPTSVDASCRLDGYDSKIELDFEIS